jgi:hypothetical protein
VQSSEIHFHDDGSEFEKMVLDTRCPHPPQPPACAEALPRAPAAARPTRLRVGVELERWQDAGSEDVTYVC